MKKYVMGVLFSGIVGMAHGYVECDDKTKCEEICNKVGLPQNQQFNGFECGETPFLKKKVCLAVNKTTGLGGSVAAVQHVCGGEAYNLTSCVKK